MTPPPQQNLSEQVMETFNKARLKQACHCEDCFLRIKSFLSSTLQDIEQKVLGVVDKVQAVEKESNGRYNACMEIRLELSKLFRGEVS